MTVPYWGVVAAGLLAVACGTQRSSSGPDISGSSVSTMSVTLDQTDAVTKAILPDGTELEFIFVDAGVFQMGSPDSELGRYGDEGPQHEVEITRPFYLGRCEVTQGE